MDRPEPRTLLERLIQESDRTLDEHCEAFERCAREHGERGATLSVRQLGRWMTGKVDSARPASRRVARQVWGHSFKKLLGPPDVSTEPAASTTEIATIVVSSRDFHQETGARPPFLHEEITMAAEESARFVRRAGIAATPETLEQLDADIRWLATEYLHRPPYAIFRPLATLRRDVFDLIDRYPRPEWLTDLYRVAGQLSALMAHASSDLGQPYAADSHTRTAWLCADLAGDNRLRAYIRWIQSNISYWRAEYRDAAELARNGRRFARDGSDLLRLASQEARALAALEDAAEADRANTHAQVALQLPSENRTIPIMGRVASIERALAGVAFETVTLAADLRDQISLFRAYPAVRDISQLPTS